MGIFVRYCTTPSEVKFKRRTELEPKLLVWWAVSAKGRSSVYIHQSNTEIYLNECIRKRLVPFIKKYYNGDPFLFWPDLARAHYSHQVQTLLTDHGIIFVKRLQNPPSVPQVRPIETTWTLLEQKVYERGWEAKNSDELAKRIILKTKEFDQKVVSKMMLGVRGNLLKMYKKGVYNIIWNHSFAQLLLLFPIKKELGWPNTPSPHSSNRHLCGYFCPVR